jgi:hypothetical protein
MCHISQWSSEKIIVNSHWANCEQSLTIGTINKGKSGRPPVSDEIVEDLKEMVKKTHRYPYPIYLNNLPRSTCHKIIKNRPQLHPYKIMYKNSNLQIIKVVFNIVIGFKITSISEFGVLRIRTNL